MNYSGKGRTQTNTTVVSCGEKVLEKGTDYSISYKNNINAGTAKMIITGKGNYTGTISKTFKIAPLKIDKAVIRHTTFTYTGKARTQSKTTVVYCGSKVLKNGTDYKITYSNNINVGKATLIVTGRGNYTGTIKKTFKIVPRGTQFSSVTAGADQLKVKWTKQAVQTTGYQVQYASNSSFTSGKKTITIKDLKAVSKVITGLKPKKTYYVRIRTYKTTGGTNYYSAWTAAKKVTLEQGAVTGSGGMRTLTYYPTDKAAAGMKVAVWSRTNAQDDLVWYTMTKQSNGSWTVQISLSPLLNDGTCHIHIYTDKNVFDGAVNFTVTKTAIKNAVNSRIHTYAKNILDSVGYNLRNAYNWVVQNISYQSLVTPITVPKSGEYAGFNRQELYFAYGYNTHMGNCFVYAGSVYWLARELGYTVRLMERAYNYGGGPVKPHGWVEIDINGTTKIMDAEMESKYGVDHYQIGYDEGMLNYMPELPAY